MMSQSMFLSRLGKSTLALTISVCTSIASAGTVVVVNVHNPVTALTRAQVADIFLARASAFPNGGDAVPIDQRDNAHSHDAFYRDVTGKSGAQLKVYWSTLIFTGRGEPPRALNNAESVKKAVSEMADAVGYIDESDVDSSVKVVLVLP